MGACNRPNTSPVAQACPRGLTVMSMSSMRTTHLSEYLRVLAGERHHLAGAVHRLYAGRIRHRGFHDLSRSAGQPAWAAIYALLQGRELRRELRAGPQ